MLCSCSFYLCCSLLGRRSCLHVEIRGLCLQTPCSVCWVPPSVFPQPGAEVLLSLTEVEGVPMPGLCFSAQRMYADQAVFMHTYIFFI